MEPYSVRYIYSYIYRCMVSSSFNMNKLITLTQKKFDGDNSFEIKSFELKRISITNGIK